MVVIIPTPAAAQMIQTVQMPAIVIRPIILGAVQTTFALRNLTFFKNDNL
jgi:hypothetical protein